MSFGRRTQDAGLRLGAHFGVAAISARESLILFLAEKQRVQRYQILNPKP